MQFEWVWKHPRKSLITKPLLRQFSKSQIRGVDGKVKILSQFLIYVMFV